MLHRAESFTASAPPRPRLASRGALLVLVVAVAGLAFWLGGRTASRPAAGVPAELALQLEPLQGALAVEQAARESLAEEVAELHAQLDAVVAEVAAGRPAAPPDPGAPEEPNATEAAGSEAAAAAGEAAVAGGPSRAPVFDVAALVGPCMSRPDAEALRARWERYQLDRLELNDRAMRASYFMTPRHRREHAALDAAFYDELGEDGYDAYLRATGKPNRIVVRELLPSGAGRSAGLEVDDEFLRYAGERVFSAAELQRLTGSGRPGELVELELIRGGQRLTLRAARGPLGVVFQGVARAPEDGC